jgi:hypothetical protein
MLRDRSYVCAGATEAPQRGRGEFRQDFNWAAGRSKPHPEPAAAAERGSGGRHAPYIWYGCQTYLPHNFCPVPDCLTILRADHARERDHRDRLPRPGRLNGRRTPPRLKKAIVCGKQAVKPPTIRHCWPICQGPGIIFRSIEPTGLVRGECPRLRAR